MPTTAAKGQTGDALRTAGATITKMHDQAIALRRELAALQADRDNLWNAMYMPDGEVSKLRDALTAEQQENEILRSELDAARRGAL